MQGLSQKHSSTDAARDIYLEFNFFDGMMVDCSDRGKSQHSYLNSSTVPCDKLSITSPADKSLGTTTGIGKKDVNFSVDTNDTPKQKVHGDTLPRKIIFPKRNTPCMSSLGIHMCECEDDSLDCNLVSCMVSPLDSRNPKIKDTSRGLKIPDEKDIKENEDTTFWWSSGEKHANPLGLKAETSSSGNNEGYRQDGRASGSAFGGKSALAAWAELVSDAPRGSSMSMTCSGERVSPKKTVRAANDRKRVPTLASHLELTESAVSHNYGENIDVFFPVPSPSLQAAPTITNSILKREFTRLKLDPRSLSVSDPVPYGTLHGLVHCTFKNGLPNYTFLLDDYEEVVTAKIWMKDTARRKDQGSWRYSFYSLRGETKKKGKSGWKHWRRKDKLGAALVGKMKISNTLCSDEKHKLSVKSECILFSARLNESAAEAQVDVSTQASSSLFETEPLGCKDAACTVCNFPSTMSASLMTSSDTLSHMLSPIAASALQSSSRCRSAGIDIVQRSKQSTPKWNLRSGLPNMGNINARAKNASQTLGVMTINGSAHVTESLPESSLSSSNQRHSELAAIIVNVPLEIQNRSLISEQHQQVSITVILPSGNHGRPLCDLKGPSPLINRWKEGGKCDCKGWDLGCGLMVLCNSSQNPKKCCANEGRKLQRNEDESDSRPLRLYKQDGDQDDAFLSLTPQANGLVALDFCAPLSPLQAFAMAVAILHGRDSNGVLDTHERKLQALADNCRKDWDGSSDIKEVVKILVNSNQQIQPQDNLDIPIVKVQGSRSVLHRGSELALSFERV